MKQSVQSIVVAIVVLLLAILVVSATATADSNLTEKLKAPEAGKVQRVTLTDGSTLVGEITDVGDTQVTIRTDMGEMKVEIDKIRGVDEISKSRMRGGEYWFPNPNETRLLIGPTAKTLKAGTGYLFDLWVFFPGVAYGITDNFMVSGGVSIFPGADDQLFYFIPKLGFSASEKVDLGVSVVILHVDNTAYLGMGNITYGEDDYSLTGGVALAWNEDEMQDEPALMLGGEYRVSRRVALVAENWYVPGGDGGSILMPAVRFFGEQMTVDLGLAYSAANDDEDDPYDEDDTSWLPYLDFVWNF